MEYDSYTPNQMKLGTSWPVVHWYVCVNVYDVQLDRSIPSWVLNHSQPMEVRCDQTDSIYCTYKILIVIINIILLYTDMM